MPLLPGKENIGHNIKEMEAAGHPKAQAVAASLHEAYDVREQPKHEREKEKYGR